jgi:hypothetical protein
MAQVRKHGAAGGIEQAFAGMRVDAVGHEGGDGAQRWAEYLYREKVFGPDDPLFPATEIALNAEHQFAAIGLSRRHWSNATPIRKVFREAFTRAGVPYFNPHSVGTRSVFWARSFVELPSSSPLSGLNPWQAGRVSSDPITRSAPGAVRYAIER